MKGKSVSLWIKKIDSFVYNLAFNNLHSGLHYCLSYMQKLYQVVEKKIFVVRN